MTQTNLDLLAPIMLLSALLSVAIAYASYLNDVYRHGDDERTAWHKNFRYWYFGTGILTALFWAALHFFKINNQ